MSEQTNISSGKIVTKVLARPRFDRHMRSRQAEWLDGEALDRDALRAVLQDLAWLNWVMLGHVPLRRWLARAIQGAPGRSFTLLDVGCGYGDGLRAVRRWAKTRGVRLKLIGIDLSAETIRIARDATAPEQEIEYVASDVFAFRPDEPIDFVCSSLFTHHLDDRQIAEFLAWMEQTATRGWFIYDLQRSPLAFQFLGVFGRLAKLHPMVVHDGQISVARAPSRAEWRRLIAFVGLPESTVELRPFWFRRTLGRIK